MKKTSFKMGFLSLLVGLAIASCTKDANEGPLSTPSEVATESEVVSPSTETTEPEVVLPSTETADSEVDSPSSGETTEPATASPSVVTVPESGVMAVAAASTTMPTTPIGYAAVNGMTTGGKGGKTVTVSTLSALKSAAASSSPMIIKVSGTIKGSTGITVKSNKTIIGLSGATLDGVGLLMYSVSNIIVQNLTIKNPSASDAITIKNKTHHIWIDHCTFASPKYDGLVDITEQSDFVTISWSKFSNASKNTLVGGGDDRTGDKGKLNVTYHHNYFISNFERSPSIRFGKGHVFNNYYQNCSGYGIASRMGAVVRAENNYFESCGNPLVTIGPTHGYFSAANTNIYKSCKSNNIKTSASTWKPSYSYSAVLIPAANVPAAVKAGAGAR